MANQTRGNTGFPNFFSAFRDDPRKEFIQAPVEAARSEIMASVLEVAGLLNVLPDAVIASQQRELARLKATRGDDDPRVVELQATLNRAADLKVMAERGHIRAQRLAVAIAGDREDAFLGFVSDTDLNPLPGLTVRAGQQYSATTDADGYFHIPLGTKTTRATGLGGILDRTGVKDPAATADPLTAQVEILQKSTVIHTDPFPLPLDDGRVYREYVIPKTPGTARDLKNFMTRNTPTEAPAGRAKGKAKRK